MHDELSAGTALQEAICALRNSTEGSGRLEWLEHASEEVRGIEVSALSSRAFSLAGWIAGQLSADQLVVLFMPHGEEFVESLLGCFLAGVTAAPLTTESAIPTDQELARLRSLLDALPAAVVLAPLSVISSLERGGVDSSRLHALPVPSAKLAPVSVIRGVPETAIALMLFTSGSTGSPKGIPLSHANVWAQTAEGRRQWDVAEGSRVLSWLSPSHNFGLFFGLLVPLMSGANVLHWPAKEFSKRPATWFEWMHKFSATHVAAPNFAFDYCTSAVEVDDLPAAALGTIELIVSGGEPVRRSVIGRFLEKFGRLGLRKDAFRPHYGMSEAGAISTWKLGDGEPFIAVDSAQLRRGRVAVAPAGTPETWLANCGRAGPLADLRVVSGDGSRVCGEQEVGEIWLRSPALAHTYDGGNHAGADLFQRRLPNGTSEGYFRTGDLGFVLNGCLFVAGREKDVIIVRGKNHFPGDIETTLAVAGGKRSIVFSRDNGEEENVFAVVEVPAQLKPNEYRQFADELRSTVQTVHGLALTSIILAEPGSVLPSGGGKVKRKPVKEAFEGGHLSVIWRSDPPATSSHPERPADTSSVVSRLLRCLRTCLKESGVPFDADTLLADFGLDSLSATRLAGAIESTFHVRLDPADLYRFQTVRDIAKELASRLTPLEPVQHLPSGQPAAAAVADAAIAIVGMQCELPGAPDSAALWSLLERAEIAVQRIDEARPELWEALHSAARRSDVVLPQWAGLLNDVEGFDAEFFGISRREAECMDPQQRKLLMLVWRIAESAGHDPLALGGRPIGLFVGVHNIDYADLVGTQPALMIDSGGYIDSGSHASMIPNRASRWFNFKGPSEAINTACSSSLVALHRAVQAIRGGECEAAFVAGINLLLAPRIFLASASAGMLSENGRCRTLDADADGFVRSEGIVGVLLKPLEAALRDGDTVLGTIASTAVNHDGRSNSLRAPNGEAQRDLLLQAYKRGGIDPSTLGYVEMHGTGTPIGDPIEFRALTEAFELLGTKSSEQRCSLGSIKSNIGHAESAAGLASVAKMLLSFKHGLKPALAGFAQLNPQIRLSESPFEIIECAEPWERMVDPADGGVFPRRAGISSFGFGGVNAHVVLEEFSSRSTTFPLGQQSKPSLIVLSARDEARLQASVRQLHEWTLVNQGAVLEDIAWTLQIGRAAFSHRLALVVSSMEELRDGLGGLVRGDASRVTYFSGVVPEGRSTLDEICRERTLRMALDTWVRETSQERLADLWTRGLSINWAEICGNPHPRRVPLPTYPFASERFWLPDARPSPVATTRDDGMLLPRASEVREAQQGVAVHPMDAATDVSTSIAGHGVESVGVAAARYLTTLLAASLRAPAEKIDTKAPLERYGIDSVMAMELTATLEETFGTLSKTLFFECQTLDALAQYFVSCHREQIDQLLERSGAVAAESSGFASLRSTDSSQPAQPEMAERAVAEAGGSEGRVRVESAAAHEDIAIVGLSGRYPRSQSVASFWENLFEGVNCVGEIPAERWDGSRNFEPGQRQPGKTYSKWGGFLDGVDQFDARFFNVSPREARSMDPQERLFLQCAHAAIEDAGHTRASLGSKVGVFVGVMYEEYQLYGAEAQARGESVALSGSAATIANRVSYWFDFHGPSLSLDTMCSSSLTAIHLACESIRSGQCEVAVAGGVNVSIHPNKYLLLSQGQFASSEGLCRSFGEGGDGYVPAEGVGAVLLKPLSRAIEDGDHVYGVIKASSINHGGKTNGYTVPNPNAQAELIQRTIKASGVPARGISYVEAHGTGTALGDPIEIAGLSKAFGAGSQDKGYCAIGSVKSNIGHAESAAGMAGLTKVLLQLKHRTLVKSLHSERLNPHIDFERTPFVVQRERGAWERPRVQEDGREKEYPRTAGLSSFGAGGSNAHLIVQEHEAQASQRGTGPALVVLSGRNEQRLQEQARQLLSALDGHTEEALHDIAYTLQVGREAMESRLACVVQTIDDLRSILSKYLKGEPGIKSLHLGDCKREAQPALIEMKAPEDGGTRARSDFLESLAARWVNGGAIAWTAVLQQGQRPQRISLPTYPFAADRYWHGSSVSGAEALDAPTHPGLRSGLVLARSDANGETFSFVTSLSGRELFLVDHVLNSQPTMPGVVSLELVRSAVMRAQDGPAALAVRIHDVAWVKPIQVGPEGRDIEVVLRKKGVSAYEFEVRASAASGEERVTHVRGRVQAPFEGVKRHVDMDALRTQSEGQINADAHYGALAECGLRVGRSLRSIDLIHLCRDENDTPFVIGALARPATDANGDEFVLHPAILDGALQCCDGLMAMGQRRPGELAVPFAVDEVLVFDALPKKAMALVRHSEARAGASPAVQRYDITVVREDGEVCVEVRGFSCRAVQVSGALQTDSVLLTTAWIPLSQAEIQEAPPIDRYVVVCELDAAEIERLQSLHPQGRVVVLSSEKLGLPRRYTHYAKQLLGFLRTLLQGRPSAKVLVQLVVADGALRSAFQGLGAMLKCAALENPRLVTQVVLTEKTAQPLAEALDVLAKAGPGTWHDGAGGWQRRHLRTIKQSTPPASLAKAGDVFLITGGAGGLGRVVARAIASSAEQTRLVLVGRREADAEVGMLIDELSSLGAQAEYQVVDVADDVATQALVSGILRRHGRLNGVIHSAGLLRDGFIIRKDERALDEVFAAKVQGLANLDAATAMIALDSFVAFASVAGVIGNIGQADYAAANAFMDEFMAHRAHLRQQGLRRGLSLSISWPLWEAGGMQVDQATRERMWKTWGQRPMASDAGALALRQAVASGLADVVVLHGDRQRIEQLVGPAQAVDVVQAGSIIEPPQTASIASNAAIEDAFLELAAAVLQIEPQELEIDSEFGEFGFDSVTLGELAAMGAKQYGIELSPTVFFEYPTIAKLAAHVMATCDTSLFTGRQLAPEVASRQQELEAHSATAPQPSEAALEADLAREAAPDRGSFADAAAATSSGQPFSRLVQEPVAIIGMSGEFPMAEDVEALWANLVGEKDCIQDIPDSRIDWSRYHGDPAREENKTNVRRAGLIQGLDRFDPLFFGISPREAEAMDPQQRLLMTHVWKVIEDAGYDADSLAGSATGVFIGTDSSGYLGQLVEAGVPIEGHTATGMAASVGPNRMSYLLDLHGPSEPVETACSSALVAMHRAMLSIQAGECDQALVGGVNTLISPELHISFSKAGMLGVDGRCKTFSAQANGYVRGEGAGMLMLKKLSAAKRDGDHIYAVIRGTAENHGGRANSLTAPNPKAQAELIRTALARAGVDPATVTYVEAHGTGTPLGDPIEVQGLKSAFREAAAGQELAQGYCGLGSVKTNIGHLELAAGVAGVIKVLLQLKHKTLAKSLYSEELNPYIELKGSPFYVVQQTQPWRALPDGAGGELPRRAGVSSFGFGGVNAHVVLEEYVDNSKRSQSRQGPALVVLSGRNEQRLQEQARQLLSALDGHAEEALHDIAYTLQVGRKAMEFRFACVVQSLQELRGVLRGYLQDGQAAPGVYTGERLRGAARRAQADAQQREPAWAAGADLAEVAKRWVAGASVDWAPLHAGHRPRRLSLPTYPFEPSRIWIPNGEAQEAVPEIMPPAPTPAHVNRAPGFPDALASLLDRLEHDDLDLDDAVLEVRSQFAR